VSTHRSHTGVKLGAKQLNIFRIGCKTTQYFWIQSLIKKKINKTHHRTFHLKKIDSSHESGKNLVTWALPALTTIIYNDPVLLTVLHLTIKFSEKKNM
jgi:hypothetical protein